MTKMEEMLKLTKQAIRVIERDSSAPTVTQLEATAVCSVAVINNYDANVFTQSVLEKAAEMERQGAAKVEVQFSTSYYSNPAGFVLMHSALLIGRNYANTQVTEA